MKITRNRNIVIIVKAWLLLQFSMRAGEFAQGVVNKFPVNIWFGRGVGILVAALVGYFVYLILFNEIKEEHQTREMTDEEEKEVAAMIVDGMDEVKVIKRIREYTNYDLVKAKNVYDMRVKTR